MAEETPQQRRATRQAAALARDRVVDGGEVVGGEVGELAALEVAISAGN